LQQNFGASVLISALVQLDPSLSAASEPRQAAAEPRAE